MRRYTFWFKGAYRGYAVGLRSAVVGLHEFEQRGYCRSDIAVLDDDGHEVLFSITW